jgi:calcineurin-like phosphoesterase family protein
MKLRTDIEPENTWIVSDTHFGHDNIVGFCHRPEDHEQAMIAEWRAHVPTDARLIHLGDLSYRANGFFKNIVAKELTGEKELILGNHDKQRYSFYRQSGFKIIKPFFIEYGEHSTKLIPMGEGMRGMKVEPVPYKVSFSHYPSSTKLGDDEVRLHGHIHNNGYTRDAFVPFLRNHINLSVEQTKYRPVNLKLLLDAYLFGEYPETTPEQLAEAERRKMVNLSRNKAT